MSRTPHLTKSKFMAGRQCPRRVWLTCNEPKLATPPDAAQRAIFEMGSEVGRHAHALFPGGVLVKEKAWHHRAACKRTARLVADESVPAIFEGAFEHEGVRIRADVLERLGGGGFGLREVKGSTSVKDPHLADVAVQKFVLEGCGLRIDSAELVHVNNQYVRGEGAIDWKAFFAREEITDTIAGFLHEVPDLVEAMHEIVQRPEAPFVEPSPHCFSPYDCEFWAHCTRNKPDDWVIHLPRIHGARLEQLQEAGIERVVEIPDDFPLSALQARVREVLRSGVPYRGAGLAQALRDAGPPAFYLDFETMSPAVPLYPGTRPYEVIPFQWSLHHADAAGNVSHREFLAEAGGDPRRALAESLLAAAGTGAEPILVYSGFESSVLGGLAKTLPDLAAPLEALRARLLDLLPIVRAHVYHAGFHGSFSLKHVAPALLPGFGYDSLEGIAEGSVASAAFTAIATGQTTGAEAEKLCEELLAYCKHDTLALVELHRTLRGFFA